MAVRIVTDSTSDLPPALCERLGIAVVPLNVHVGERVYRDGVDLDAEQFFQILAARSDIPRTSQPSPALFAETYRQLTADGSAVVSIHISSKLSGTVRSALLARDGLPEPEQVTVIDSLSASLGLGLLVLEAAEQARAGASRETIVSWIERRIPMVRIMFVVDTLEYLQRGGRIGRASAFLGSLLSIRPILKLEEGEVQPVERVRTRARALDRLAEFVETFPRIDRLAILHGGAPGEAAALLDRIGARCPAERVLVGRYGPVIGAHAGPGGIGVVVLPGWDG
jgi:DegV family protein with EDD domain